MLNLIFFARDSPVAIKQDLPFFIGDTGLADAVVLFK
jgi:hypothetical protein